MERLPPMRVLLATPSAARELVLVRVACAGMLAIGIAVAAFTWHEPFLFAVVMLAVACAGVYLRVVLKPLDCLAVDYDRRRVTIESSRALPGQDSKADFCIDDVARLEIIELLMEDALVASYDTYELVCIVKGDDGHEQRVDLACDYDSERVEELASKVAKCLETSVMRRRI